MIEPFHGIRALVTVPLDVLQVPMMLSDRLSPDFLDCNTPRCSPELQPSWCTPQTRQGCILPGLVGELEGNSPKDLFIKLWYMDCHLLEERHPGNCMACCAKELEDCNFSTRAQVGSVVKSHGHSLVRSLLVAI